MSGRFWENNQDRLEMFGQRTVSGFPQGMDPMHVPGSSGEYIGDVFAKSESGWEHHQYQMLRNGRVGKQRFWGGNPTSMISLHGPCKRAWNLEVRLNMHVDGRIL